MDQTDLTPSPEKVSLKNRLTQKISSCSLDKEELLKLCHVLEERSAAAADVEITHLQKGNYTDSEFERVKTDLREGFRLKATVTGTDGEELWGPVIEVLTTTDAEDFDRSAIASRGWLDGIPLRAARFHGDWRIEQQNDLCQYR